MPPEMPPSDHEREKIERLKRAMYSRDLSDQFGEHPRHRLGEETGVIDEEWQAPQEHLAGVSVSPKYAGAARKILLGLLWAAIGFCVIALSVFAYYFLIGAGSFSSSSNIDIVINGPAEIPSSSPTELQISIANHNSAPLELAELVITYPDGTRATGDAPPAHSCDTRDTDPATGVMRSERICLGSIPAGATQPGTITPIFSGASGAKGTVKIELQYHLGGSNAIFTAVKEYSFTFKTSSISLAVNGNTQTISGQSLDFSIGITSNATITQKDVVLHIDYPFGYTLKSSQPAANLAGIWYIGDLAPGETKNVILSGTMQGQAGDTRVFHITAGVGGATSTMDTALAMQLYQLKIADTFLGLSISANTGQDETPSSTFSPSTATTPYATPGSLVSVTVRYVNNLSSEIDNAVIVARLTGASVDGTTVRTPDGIYRSSDGVVYWDAATSQGKLARIAPGEGGSLTFTFQAPDAIGTNPHVDISVNAAGKRVDQSGVPQSLQAAATQKILLASKLQFVAQGFYYRNDFGTNGPMPPRAEQETTYEMLFSVTNTTSNIKNARVSAHLPPYVRWTNRFSPRGAKLSLNQATGVIMWDIGDITPGTGVNGSEPKQAAIEIGFTPSTSQIGQTPVLLENVALTGTDAATGQSVTLTTSPDLTTNLMQIARSSSTDVAPAPDPGFSSSNATVVR